MRAQRTDDNVDLLVVHLVLTHHWFDEMAAGRKDVEYRRKGIHWTRIIWKRANRITHARFSRGYTSTTITRPVVGIDIGPCPIDGWPGVYYRLQLGPIMDNTELCGGAMRSPQE